MIKMYIIYLLKTSTGYKIGQTTRSEYDRMKEESRKHKKDTYEVSGAPIKMYVDYKTALLYESYVRMAVGSLGLIHEGNDYFRKSRYVDDTQVRDAFMIGIKQADRACMELTREVRKLL